MTRHQTTLSYGIVVLQVFLILFSLLDPQALPSAFSYAGKFHPLLLHLPITLGIILLPLSIWIHKINNAPVKAAFKTVLLYNALLATTTALGGLFLSSNNEYDQDTLFNHKWSGVGIALFSHALVYIYPLLEFKQKYWNLSIASSIALLIFGSHYGGTLTHGEDFLSFNSKEEIKNLIPVIDKQTTVYEAGIQPILNAKCVSCHNDQKKKGGLNFSSVEQTLKGGKHGAIWTAGDPSKSEFIQRLLLELDDKKHMPPKGKSQLLSDEIALFSSWVQQGADVKKTFLSLSNEDTLKLIIDQLHARIPTKKEEKIYSFKSASADDIASLNTPFRRVIPLAFNSPALSIKFYLKEKFNIELLKECAKINKQVVEINLSTMPVDDKILPILAEFEHLERINLNGTLVTGTNFSALAKLKFLEQVSLTGTAIDKKALEQLANTKSLKKVFIWNTQVSETDIVELQKKYSSIQWDKGYIPNPSEILKLTPPYPINREKTILEPGESISLKHPLPGVTIRYSLDGTSPDTLQGSVYTKPIPANGLIRIISVATNNGWLSSNLSDYTFFQKGFSVDSAVLLNEPDNRYKKAGAKALIDLTKGFVDNLGMNWLGFREKSMKAGFHFSNNPMLKQIVMSMADNTGAYVFPPTQITIRGGSNAKNMKTIGTLTPEMPTAYRGNSVLPYVIPLVPGNYAYIEIEAQNITKLPKWHNGKGEKGWVFVDEVFFY